MKCGKFTISQVLGFILGIAGVILIILIMVGVLSPIFNQEDETTKAYLRLMTDSIAEVDDGYSADFSMWQPEDDEDKDEKREYYVVYFGQRATYEEGGKAFFVSGIYRNYICVCAYKNGDAECSMCEELDFPARNDGNVNGWLLGVRDKARITKSDDGDYYDFDVTKAEVEAVSREAVSSSPAGTYVPYGSG